MKQSRGFTVIEIVVVLLFVAIGATIYFTQKASTDAAARDDSRRTAINAMYYNLEEVYYPQAGYYPQTIDSKTLRAMDPAFFTDPSGKKLGEAASTYLYQPTDCSTDGKCRHYTLTAVLEHEAVYTKTSRR